MDAPLHRSKQPGVPISLSEQLLTYASSFVTALLLDPPPLKARECDFVFLAVGGDFAKEYAEKLTEGVRDATV